MPRLPPVGANITNSRTGAQTSRSPSRHLSVLAGFFFSRHAKPSRHQVRRRSFGYRSLKQETKFLVGNPLKQPGDNACSRLAHEKPQGHAPLGATVRNCLRDAGDIALPSEEMLCARRRSTGGTELRSAVHRRRPRRPAPQPCLHPVTARLLESCRLALRPNVDTGRYPCRLRFLGENLWGQRWHHAFLAAPPESLADRRLWPGRTAGQARETKRRSSRILPARGRRSGCWAGIGACVETVKLHPVYRRV
jgi:hypothetical protein